MSGGLSQWLFRSLSEPATRGIPVDDPELTIRRRRLAKDKRGLYLSYRSWYADLEAADREAPEGLRVELGSGGGFLDERIPGLLTTDLLKLPFTRLVCRGEALPFGPRRVGALFLINVLHHVTDVEAFFEEALRVLAPGGTVAMIEPWVTPLSRLIYPNLHPEPFEPDAADWKLPPAGPLSGGNDALPWILFVRDRERFSQRFPDLEIVTVRPHTWIVHLLSGGVMVRSLLPGFAFPVLDWVEQRSPAWVNARTGLFATVVLRRRG